MNNEISNKLRSLRIEKGLSKQEMAEKLSLELTAYNRLESGRVNTWGKYFIEICVIFSITPSAFFNDIIIVEKTFVSKTSLFDENKIK